MRIRFIDARYPGASHDAHIWGISEAKAIMQRSYLSGKRNTWLLGDAGYALEPYLMTPFRASTNNTPKSNYNSVHAKARNIVERTFGVLKNRFRCLLSALQLHYDPHKATVIANVCAALHNICIEYGAPNLIMESPPSDPLPNLNESEVDNENENQLAAGIRMQIMNSLNQ
ncbi:PREDICTED: putative nuclease HARBI1 [Rhagoletis zephyria]|uniref:putative nuclease HARBI1 n=1 Tax=Rhagoletis zephyria TaxID=28612 RepID=UPI00081125D6|nr:PREDICTED: putative nuclease HARBI1 [Rhagoletis zephyria]